MSILIAQEMLRNARNLPALSAVVLELIHCVDDPHANMEQLAVQISHDQALASKTLRLANSSFYGLSRQVISISEAVTMLGLRTVRSIATAAGVVHALPRPNDATFDFDAFWRHAVAAALCARALAQAAKLNEDAAFTVGLLHDLGELVLATHYPEHCASVAAYRSTHNCLNLEAERAVLGTDHAELGGQVAAHWNFAASMVVAITDHHSPIDVQEACLVDVLHVADSMVYAIDHPLHDGGMVPPLPLAASQRLGLGKDAYAQVLQSTRAEYAAVCQILLT